MKIKKIVKFLLFFAIFVVFTFLVKNFDLKPIGVDNTMVGFATLNGFIHSLFPYNAALYKSTTILGYINPICIGIFGGIGSRQLVVRKNLLKVDKDILALGVFFILAFVTNVFFEKIFIINYRPVMIEEVLEGSYPSSHVFFAISVIGSCIINMRNRMKNNLIRNILTYLGVIIIALITFGRFFAGVHWTTDIIGGIILGISYLYLYDIFVEKK